MGFKIHKASVLTEEELGHLIVRGTSLNVVAKLQEHGAMAEEPCAAIVMSVEQGKVQVSMWMVTGNLGNVKFRESGREQELECVAQLDGPHTVLFPQDSRP